MKEGKVELALDKASGLSDAFDQENCTLVMRIA